MPFWGTILTTQPRGGVGGFFPCLAWVFRWGGLLLQLSESSAALEVAGT